MAWGRTLLRGSVKRANNFGRLELGTPMILIWRSHSALAAALHSSVHSCCGYCPVSTGFAVAWDSGGTTGLVVHGAASESFWLFCLASSDGSDVSRGCCGRSTNRGFLLLRASSQYSARL